LRRTLTLTVSKTVPALLRGHSRSAAARTPCALPSLAGAQAAGPLGRDKLRLGGRGSAPPMETSPRATRCADMQHTHAACRMAPGARARRRAASLAAGAARAAGCGRVRPGAAGRGRARPGARLGHGAPDLHALHVGDVARAREVQPVGLVQLGPDQEVQIADALVLAHQRRRQAQLAVRLDDANHLRTRACSLDAPALSQNLNDPKVIMCTPASPPGAQLVQVVRPQPSAAFPQRVCMEAAKHTSSPAPVVAAPPLRLPA